jgi:hypothetical protein
MMEWLFPLAVTVILTVVKQVIKNPTKKEELKAAMIKVRDSIDAAYAIEESTENYSK